MLISVIPTTFSAEDISENTAIEQEETNETNESEPTQSTTPPAIDSENVEEITEIPAFDVDFTSTEVIYNLGNQEITVGFDLLRAEETPHNYKLFDGYGNFIIQLEDNAFFPYEVQFQYNGEIFVEWFETPQSTVQIGNHIFSVETVQNNPNLLQSISLNIGSDVIRLRPEPKVFTNELFEAASLLPLEFIQLQTINLYNLGYDRFQLANVRVSSVFSQSDNYEDGQRAVWIRNNYLAEIIQGDTIDFSNITSNAVQVFEFIVGTTAQLDPNNTRYRLQVQADLQPIVTSVQIYGNGSQVTSNNLTSLSSWQNVNITVPLPHLVFNPVYLNIQINQNLLTNRNVTVVNGSFETAEDAQAAILANPNLNVTSQIVDQDMSLQTAGFQVETAGYHNFAILFFDETDNTTVVGFSTLEIRLSSGGALVQTARVFREVDGVRTMAEYVWASNFSTVYYATGEVVPRQSAEFNLIPTGFNIENYFLTLYDTNFPLPENMRIIRGSFANPQNALNAAENNPNLDVTSILLDPNITAIGAGYEINFTTTANTIGFSLVFFDDDENIAGFSQLDIVVDRRETTVQSVQLHELVDNERNLVRQSSNLSVGASQSVTLSALPFRTNLMQQPHYLSIALQQNLPQHSEVRIISGNYGSITAALNALEENPALNVTSDILDSNRGVRIFTPGAQDFTLLFYDGDNVIGFRRLAVTVNVSNTPNVPQPLPPPTPGVRQDPFMNITGAYARATNGTLTPLQQVYLLPGLHDTYHSQGFQTVFYLDDVPLNAIVPTFIRGNNFVQDDENINIFAGHIGNTGLLQESGVWDSNIDFSQGVQQYAALTADMTIPVDERGLRNYWVTFVPLHRGGSQLFVNGINGANPNVREVFLNDAHNNVHDIFIANVGDEPLTGLNVEWQPANEQTDNIKLDEYWTIGGENNDTLAAFTTTETPDSYNDTGELPNVAKIRLVPNGIGAIEGTLTITADGHEEIIRITGEAGNPRILTENVHDAVLYVPYQALIMASNMYPWNNFQMSLVSGRLPDGVYLFPSGEIYGTPTEMGEFPFTVRMVNSHPSFENTDAELTLTVLENTNINVSGQISENHDITQWIGTPTGDPMVDDIILTNPADPEQNVLLTLGLYDEFIDLWLNGVLLTSGTHYDGGPGSTRIAVFEQTFRGELARQGERNTISAEFREGGRANVGTPYEMGGEVRTAPQNFILNIDENLPGGGNGGNGGGNGGNGGGNGGNQGGGNGGNETQPPGGGDNNQGGNNNQGNQGNQGGNQNNQNENNNESTPNVPIQPPRPTAPTTGGETTQPTESQPTAQQPPTTPTQPATTPQPPIIPVIPPPVANVVTIQPSETTANTATFMLPMDAIIALLSDSNNTILLDMGSFGTLTLDYTTLLALSALFGDLFTFTIATENGQIFLQLSLDDTQLNTINGGLRLALPNIAPLGVPENEIVVLLTTNGTTSTINKSFAENGVVYALITELGTISVTSNFTPFNDVEPTNWFAGAVQFVVNRGILAINNLQNLGLFNPQTLATRAETINAFFELENTSGTFSGTAMFNDISAENPQAIGVNWAASLGIIQGFGDGTFRPNDSITRQQIAVILMNYANAIGLDTSARGNIANFADTTQVAPWADDAIRWAVGSGLMQGDGFNLNPNNNATRAEVSQIVQNMVRLIVR